MESNAITAFFTHLETYISLPIAWPNLVNKEIESNPMFLHIDVINTTPQVIKTNGRSRHKWILQASVFFRKNVGVYEALQQADSVVDGVPFNTVLESGGYTFKTTSQGAVKPVIEDDVWQAIPVHFTFQTFKQRGL